MSPALLDLARFANFLGRDPADDALVYAVELAEELVTAEAGAALTDPPQPSLSAVAFGVAARLLAGPIGVTSESEGGTAFSYAATVGTPALLDAERAAIRRATGRYGGLGEIALTTPGARVRRFDPGRPHWSYLYPQRL